MAKKKLTEDNYWAQQIIRAQQDGKDCIFALVRRRYSDDDIEQTGPGEYIGVDRKESFPKITDNDPESDTFTERIDKPNASATGVKLVYLDEFSPKNIEKYQKMSGITSYGQTQLIYKFRQMSITADKETEFWTESQDEIYNKYVLKQVIIVEKNKSDDRRVKPKTA